MIGQEASVTSVVNLIADGGVIALLILALYGSIRAWWVPGWLYREKVKEADEWKKEARTNIGLAETAVKKGQEDY